MYEAYTYEFLLDRTLKNAKKNNPSIDTREGSIIYNAVAPTCLELAILYTQLDNILNETFADTASRNNLIKRCAERGITVQPATQAIRLGLFNSDAKISIGDRFSLHTLNYKVIKEVGAGRFQLECETAGIVGNMESGNLIPIDYIEGLTTAELTDVLIAGEDEEDTEVLRERFFNSLNAKSFGGNITDYKEKTKDINGVGGVKVYPVWNGGGTVKLVIIDTDYNKPSQTLIDTVQAEIDPLENQGQGLGTAPIGHTVTVEGVSEQSVNIKTKIVFRDGWDWLSSQIYIDEVIDNYLKELSKSWDDEKNLIVRISQIESKLLNSLNNMILDISDTLLDDESENIIIDENSIPVRGSVTSV